ncbi:MAG: methylmalonyl-CoA mutase, partial [Actinobacteria bacterium]
RMRFHTQTAGSTLTAQQPLNNVVRTAYQGLAAVLGGTQSLHTNSFDEALGLPTNESAMLALRTQQILGFETGVPGVVDPLAGSYYVESLTDRIEADAMDLIARIDEFGGAPMAIEEGFQQREIEEAAYSHARSLDAGETALIGVNRFVETVEVDPDLLSIDQGLEPSQRRALEDRRERRDDASVAAALADLSDAAQGSDNVLYPMKTALEQGATVGDITRTLVPVFGRYRPSH